MLDAKEQWIKELRAGDIVCTCRYEHREIVRIEDNKRPAGNLILIPWILAVICLPAAVVIYLIMEMGPRETHDRTVYFEDGRFCSARHCLDPIKGCTHA